ncbi:MAG: phosphate-binding protein PstS [Gemmatales bacterium]|nr:MAG: phosphate-binding protein PstS [Gemmatales bacterium]
MLPKKWGLRCVVSLVVCIVVAIEVRAGEADVDPKLPDYKPARGVSGTIKSVGSDTMNNLMTLLTESFNKIYPNVQAEIEGKGSSTAPPALIAGTALFGPMSRPMKSQEIDAFKKRYGYAPVGLPAAIDMLAVYVHRDNPIKGLTLQQVDAIFSKTRKSGHGVVKTWGDLGLTGEWASKPIALYGRNSASGTYGYFKKAVLLDGDFKDEVKEQPGSSAVVQGVANDKFAIGYSGIGYKTADVRAVPLARNAKAEFVPPEAERAYKGEYPLARILYIYVNYKPGSDLDPLRREFIKYLYSKQGQLDIVRSGYLPVGSLLAKRGLGMVNLK